MAAQGHARGLHHWAQPGGWRTRSRPLYLNYRCSGELNYNGYCGRSKGSWRKTAPDRSCFRTVARPAVWKLVVGPTLFNSNMRHSAVMRPWPSCDSGAMTPGLSSAGSMPVMQSAARRSRWISLPMRKRHKDWPAVFWCTQHSPDRAAPARRDIPELVSREMAKELVAVPALRTSRMFTSASWISLVVQTSSEEPPLEPAD